MVKCEGRVYHGVRPIGKYFPCENKGKVERDGKHYCGVHDPEKRTERSAAREQKWAAERMEVNKRVDDAKETQRRAGLYEELLACLEWFVENDDTNDGGVWEDVNSFWLAGLRRAQSVIAKAKGEQQ